jgi:hypothetical protein
MTQEPNKPINLSVHETADPSLFSQAVDKEVSGDLNDLNDSVHDDENVDVPTPGLLNNGNDENPGDRQISIANLSAG